MIDWSHDLLNEVERAVLARLSVFAGGWSLRAAEVVCTADGLKSSDVVDVLGSLVDKSLVHAEPVESTIRYRLLETIREYAADQLLLRGAAEVQAVRRLHAGVFLELAETGAPHLTGADYGVWLTRLEQEHDNLRVALAFFLSDESTVDRALTMGVALHEFWFYRAYFEEGVEALEAGLEHPGTQERSALRAAALTAAGKLRYDRGDYPVGRARLEEGLALARGLDDSALAADALNWLGWIEFRQGHQRTARARAEEAVALARKADHTRLIANALNLRATVSVDVADRTGARSDFAEALDRFQAAGNRRSVGTVLNNLAILDLHEGNYDSARTYLDEALTSARVTGDVGEQLILLCNLGLVAFLLHEPLAAQQYFTDTLTKARRSGSQTLVAYAVLGLALCATTWGDQHRAATLHGAADTLLQGLGETLESLEEHLRELDLDHLRETLGPQAFEIALSAGRALLPEDAIALALEGTATG